MNVVLVRGFLALLALAFALAGQYFLEHEEALAPGLYLFLAGGLALAAAYINGPTVFLPSSLESNLHGISSERAALPRFPIAAPIILLLLGLSLFRSFSNPDDSLAWILHIASIVVFLAFFTGLSPSGILGRVRQTIPRPSKAALIEGGLLLGILALALFLRLLVLKDMPFGLWYDEGVHGMSAVKILEEGSYRPIFVPEANVASPMIFMQAVSIWLLGRNTVALRLPSVLMDLGVIFLLYFLVRRFLGWRVALVVALLVAVSSWDITWARNAMPGVTAPLLAVAGILSFLWALRRGTLASYALAGVVLGSGIWFYQAVRIMPAVIVLIAAYAFFRDRLLVREFVRKFGVYVAGALLVAAPLLQYSVTHATEFWRRAGAVTAYRTGWSLDSLSFLKTNLDEYLLMFNYQGDINGRHNLPHEPMLSFGVAALAFLGFLFCLSRPHRPVPFLLLIWFFFALLPGLVTLPFEAPNTLRAIGSIPVAYLFAGVGIAAVGKALAPLVPRYAGVVLGVPLAIGLGAIAYDNFHTYFHLQRNSFAVWASFNPEQTAIAYRLMELPSQDYDVQLGLFLPQYPVITFLLPVRPRIETYEPAKHPPSSTRGDGALIFLDSSQEPFLGRIKEFYPQGNYSRMDFGQGPRQPVIYTVELDGEDITRAQGLTLRLTPLGTSTRALKDMRVPQVDLSWEDASVPTLPFSAEWRGVLYVPKYGDYGLALEGSPQAQLYLDGSLVLEGPGDVQLPLGTGSHAIVVKEEVQETEGRTRLSWEPPKGQLSIIGPQNLYSGMEAHGLLGSYFPPDYPTASGAFQQIDPMVFFYFHHRPFAGEFHIQWEGELQINGAETYSFTLDSSGPATLSIDGDTVIKNPGIPTGSVAPLESCMGEVKLEAGLHPIKITFQHKNGSPQVYLHWSSPYESPSPIPWSRFHAASPKSLQDTNDFPRTAD
ncbi:MAG: PA14 domain-containing protein [Chloroflexota bacterium]